MKREEALALIELEIDQLERSKAITLQQLQTAQKQLEEMVHSCEEKRVCSQSLSILLSLPFFVIVIVMEFPRCNKYY